MKSFIWKQFLLVRWTKPVQFTVCKADINYHRSKSSCWNDIHWTLVSTREECGTCGRITKSVSEKLINSLVTWIVKNFRPLSAVEDVRLREVICVASGDTAQYNRPVRNTDFVWRWEGTVEEQARASKTHRSPRGDWTSGNNNDYSGVTVHLLIKTGLCSHALWAHPRRDTMLRNVLAISWMLHINWKSRKS